MNRKVNAFSVLVLSIVLPFYTFSQGPTWYSTSSGSWGDAIWSTTPGGTGSLSDPDDPSINLVIQNGHDIILQASEKAVANFTVEVGATVKVGTSNTRYIEIYGDAILDGDVGGSSDGLSFDINGSQCRISGLGQTYLKRLRKDNDPSAASTTNLTIDKSLILTYTSSNSAALYNNGAPNSKFHITINAGKTVTVRKADVSIDGIDGSNSVNLGGSLTVDGTLDIEQGDLWLATDNSSSYDVSYQIGKNGKLIIGGHIFGNQGQAGTAKATLTGSGQLWLEDSGHIFQDLHASRNSIIFQNGARVVFAQANTQYLPVGIIFPDVSIRGGGNKRLQGDLQINGTLRLEGGFLTLDDYDLTLSSGGHIIGGSPLSYVKTNGAGVLKRRVGSSLTSFPIGNSSYNPCKLLNTLAAGSDWYGIRVMDAFLDEGEQGQAVVSEAIDRSWIMEEEVNGGSDLYIELQWNQADELAGFERENCYVTQWLNGGWQPVPADPASGNGPYRQQLEEVEEVSVFSVKSSAILPIELSYFRAHTTLEGILLSWQTQVEENNDYMAIERSRDGVDFQEIGRVDGQGNSYLQQNYEYKDRYPKAGVNYYRLRQVDFDGTTAFHQMVSASWQPPAEEILLYPTVANYELHLSWNFSLAESMTIQVYDHSGKLLQKETLAAANNQWNFPTSSLANGLYYIRYEFGGQVKTQRFLVNR